MTSTDPKVRKKNFQERRLEMLTYIRDALERRLASVKASIETLELQMNREE